MYILHPGQTLNLPVTGSIALFQSYQLVSLGATLNLLQTLSLPVTLGLTNLLGWNISLASGEARIVVPLTAAPGNYRIVLGAGGTIDFRIEATNARHNND